MKGALGLFGGKKKNQNQSNQDQNQNILPLFQDLNGPGMPNQQMFPQNFENNFLQPQQPISYPQKPYQQPQNIPQQQFQPQQPLFNQQPQITQPQPQTLPQYQESHNIDPKLEEYINTSIENAIEEKLTKIKDEITQKKV